MKANRRILIIDDERPILLTLEALLSRHGFETETAATAASGLKALKNKAVSLVLLDLQLPDAEGLQLLDQIKTERPETQVIILTAHDTLNNAIESIKRGAFLLSRNPTRPRNCSASWKKRWRSNRFFVKRRSCDKKQSNSRNAWK